MAKMLSLKFQKSDFTNQKVTSKWLCPSLIYRLWLLPSDMFVLVFFNFILICLFFGSFLYFMCLICLGVKVELNSKYSRWVSLWFYRYLVTQESKFRFLTDDITGWKVKVTEISALLKLFLSGPWLPTDKQTEQQYNVVSNINSGLSLHPLS